MPMAVKERLLEKIEQASESTLQFLIFYYFLSSKKANKTS